MTNDFTTEGTEKRNPQKNGNRKNSGCCLFLKPEPLPSSVASVVNAVYNKDGARGRSVLEALPLLPEYRTVLYVGANSRRFQLYGMIRDKEVTVLEVYEPYVHELRTDRRRPVARVIWGDVRRVMQNARLVADAPYDLLVWWHGPEHVSGFEARDLLRPGGMFCCFWRRAILLGCPWGLSPQEAIDGNAHQAHRWEFYPEWFEELGYRTICLGRQDKPRSHITAWRTR